MSRSACVLKQFFVFGPVVFMMVFVAASLRADEEPKAGNDSGNRTLSFTLNAVPAAEDEKPAAKTGEEKADAEKQQKQAEAEMQKAMEQAQKAYEEEKRKLKEKLEKDPQWQASHKQSAVIAVSGSSDPTVVHTFCLNAKGNLLVGCGGVEMKLVDGPGQNEVTMMENGKQVTKHYVEEKSPTEIRVYSPEGKKLDTWKTEIEPQALCIDREGTIYVGGKGKLLKLSPQGKLLKEAESPAVAEPKSEKKAEAKSEEEEGDDKAEDQKEKSEKAESKKKASTGVVTALIRALGDTATPQVIAPTEPEMPKEQLGEVTGIAVTERDLFVVTRQKKGYGFCVWRLDHELQNPKMVLEGLAGCCGQMDVQAKNGDFWVAHNARHKVERYNREGKQISSFGKTDRMAADGFGGCCEPKNLRFGPENVILACESGPPTCVKRFTLDGKFLNVAAIAPWDSGCVRVTTEVNGDGSRIFVLNSDANAIHVFTEKKETAEEIAKKVEAARKKMAEAKAKMDEAKGRMDEAKKQIDEAKKEIDEARKELVETTKKQIKLAPAVRLRVANNAVVQAQDSYAEEQRKQQDRLKNDPKWQPSHEPGKLIVVDPNSKNSAVHTFCLNGEGNLLVGCSIFSHNETTPLEKAGDVNIKPIRTPEIRILNQDGEKLESWKIEAEPQAICIGEGGTIFVGGAGKLIKFDRTGKILLSADAPNAVELPPPAEPEKKSEPEDASVKKEREAKIADLQKKVAELLKDYMKVVQEAQKDLKQDDEASMKAYQEKIREPLEKYQTASQELNELRLTPEMRAQQARAAWEQKMTITSIAVSGNDVFLACPMTKSYGYAVWRTNLDFGEPKLIIEKLAGCCMQMDIKAKDGEVWVAHNGKHKVERYDRDGKMLSSFGKTDRINADGFGGCCEPKNLRFGAEGDLYACESGPPTCVKHFNTNGEFLGVVAIAPWTSGCVRVTTEVNADGSKYFVLKSEENSIQVFTKKKAETEEKKAVEDAEK